MSIDEGWNSLSEYRRWLQVGPTIRNTTPDKILFGINCFPLNLSPALTRPLTKLITDALPEQYQKFLGGLREKAVEGLGEEMVRRAEQEELEQQLKEKKK